MCNLINNIHKYIHILHRYIDTYIYTYIHTNDSDDRAGLRGYVQFNKCTYIHTYTHTYIHTYIHHVISIIDPPSGGSMRVA